MKVYRLILMLILSTIINACSDDSDRQVNTCCPAGAEVILFMQHDPECLDSHADIQFTVSDGNTEYVLLELLFDIGPPYNTPFSEIMEFPCVDSLRIDFMCYSENYWQHFTGSVKVPVTCREFSYIGVYADTENPLSIFRDYDGYVAVEVDELYKCAEVESLYFAWGSVPK
jgi:hypothetical protein